MLAFSPLTQDAYPSTLSSGAHSSSLLVSPLTPAGSWGSGIPHAPPELDSTPVGEGLGVLRPIEAAELDSRPVAEEAAEGTPPRATLNSTQQEREAGTYANSWTRFQNVQV